MAQLLAEQTAENAKLVDQGKPGVQAQTTVGIISDKDALFQFSKSVLMMQSRGCTSWRNSSWLRKAKRPSKEACQTRTTKENGWQRKANNPARENLTSKSEVEQIPLFAQVGTCRQRFRELFDKECCAYRSTVSQGIHAIHKHTNSHHSLVPPEPAVCPSHAQPHTCDVLSLFRDGERNSNVWCASK